jgi:hypothetical protein
MKRGSNSRRVGAAPVYAPIDFQKGRGMNNLTPDVAIIGGGLAGYRGNVGPTGVVAVLIIRMRNSARNSVVSR